MFAVLFSLFARALATQVVTLNFNNAIFVSQTQLTFQVVINPLLDTRTCRLAKNAWKLAKELTDLGATHVRYAGWFPYPKYGVAQLDPPNNVTKYSGWAFSDLSVLLSEYLKATLPKPIVINFSTQPAWFYNGTWAYPKDPRQVDWTYSNAMGYYSNTTRHLADYYGRLLSWLVKGHFVDEFGRNITGGPRLGKALTHFEIYNEIDQGCHGITPQLYNDQYDAIVASIRREADPQHNIKFVGLALDEVDAIAYPLTFLNATLHARNTPIDFFSFHHYEIADKRDDALSFERMVRAVEAVVPSIKRLVAIRDALNPNVRLSMDECGTILPDDNENNATEPTDLYYQASGATFAYSFVNVAEMGIDILGMSQLVGSPPIAACGITDAQYPSVSMFDWKTGEGNARANVLKLLLKNFAVGTTFFETSITPGPIVARAFVSANDASGAHRLLLINTSHRAHSVSFDGRTVHLKPFEVAVRAVM